ncbi:MAG: phosphate-selective porin [Gemmataceae bacterium]|nr:phosphate-selective porin [Gemmataceae bacterium]
MRITDADRFWWAGVVALGWLLADRPAGASGQPVSPSPPQVAEATRGVPPDPTLAGQVYDFSRQIRNLGRAGGVTGAGDDGRGTPGTPSAEAADVARTQAAGGGSKTSGGDPTTTGRAQEVGNPHLGQLPLKSVYDFDNDGFRWSTQDDEYSLGIRGMSQLDALVYGRPSPGAATSGFYNPRTRVYFEGNVTKSIQYEFSFQNFYDTVSLVDAYVDFSYDPRFQVRIGRYKTPFTYEFYRVHVWDLLSPERSLFTNNYGANRRFGLMAHGSLLDQRVEYAVGMFDTQRNSFRPFNHLQDVEAFLNFKPFYNDEDSVLRDLQFGGSVDAGSENQSPVPAVLRTNQSPGAAAVDSTAASNAASAAFLAFNPGVIERGNRALWELHAAYYKGGLSLLGAWQGGYESYAFGALGPVRVPIHGWFLQAGYIITGETIRDRTLVQPLRPFDLRAGRFGLGAFEPTARYSELNLDPRVFTAGFANPALWTDRAQLIDVGCNWYLNKFVKVYCGWEHAMFGSPVLSNAGGFTKSNDLFWTRVQLYF